MPERAKPRLASRFTRAVHIQRDFHDLRYRLDGYQVTPLVRQQAARVMAGLAPEQTERAFSVIGPFGSGKSAFGLFMAHYLQRSSTSRYRLLESLRALDATTLLPLDAPSLLSVLVPGNNSSLCHAIVRSLGTALNDSHLKSSAFVQLRAQIVESSSDPTLDPVRVADLVTQAAQLVQAHSQGRYQGLFVLIDELGQFLDYAAHQDDERDLFVLQSLAEAAARSAGTPLLLMTILHQAFEQYALHAGTTRRIEWAKVQGRFVDLTFQEPSSQMMRMLALALMSEYGDLWHEQREQWAALLAPQTEALGLRPGDIAPDEWRQLLHDAYPLHPTVLVALPAIFRQLAQNERSLFAFIYSDEPWALRDLLRSAPESAAPPIYRLTHLYAYVEASLGPSLFSRAKGLRWAELAEARSLLLAGEPLPLDVLTVVGTIGALERAAGLRASQAHIALALRDTPDDPAVADTLLALQNRRLITYRQHRDSYIIWEGSDLDLDALTQETRRELAQQVVLPSLLQRHADTTPRIARRHSYLSGATRAFAVRYVDMSQLTHDEPTSLGFDGELLHVVPADEEELSQAEHWASDPARDQELARIVVLPPRVRELRDLLLDVAALHYVLETREELEHDRPARREVAGRLLEAQHALTQVIAETYTGQHSRWFYRHQQHAIVSARQIDDLLSSAADSTYAETPRIWNELIMRRQLSGAAAKARRNLVEAMLEHAHEEHLGIVGYPPERAIYESVLRKGGLHRQAANGEWELGPPPPEDPLHLRPAWHAMERYLESDEHEPRSLTGLLSLLEGPPFGVKSGLAPLLFMTLYVVRAGEINLYERGNFVAMPDIATFERLLTRPDQFAVRLSRAEGARWQVYERLAKALAPRALELRTQPALVAVVMPLLRIHRNLPAYSKQTRRVSQQAQAVRVALHEARSPDELLFERLPRALGLAPFRSDDPEDMERVDAFAALLRAHLQELQDAYPRLLQTIAAQIYAAFGLRTQGTAARAELQQRYAVIADATNDVHLRKLGVRLETADHEGDAWVESIAALLLGRPPEAWTDQDVAACEIALADLARRFHAAEELALNARVVPAETPLLRVGLANGHGEVSRVLHVSTDDQAMLRLRDELSATLGRHTNLSPEQRAAALATLLQGLLT